jgi:hypothetical protein
MTPQQEEGGVSARPQSDWNTDALGNPVCRECGEACPNHSIGCRWLDGICNCGPGPAKPDETTILWPA